MPSSNLCLFTSQYGRKQWESFSFFVNIKSTTIRKSRSPQQLKDFENLLLSITYQLCSSGRKKISAVLYESTYPKGIRQTSKRRKVNSSNFAIFSQTKTGHIRMRFYFSIRFNDCEKKERMTISHKVFERVGWHSSIAWKKKTWANFLAHIIQRTWCHREKEKSRKT